MPSPNSKLIGKMKTLEGRNKATLRAIERNIPVRGRIVKDAITEIENKGEFLKAGDIAYKAGELERAIKNYLLVDNQYKNDAIYKASEVASILGRDDISEKLFGTLLSQIEDAGSWDLEDILQWMDERVDPRIERLGPVIFDQIKQGGNPREIANAARILGDVDTSNSILEEAIQKSREEGDFHDAMRLAKILRNKKVSKELQRIKIEKDLSDPELSLQTVMDCITNALKIGDASLAYKMCDEFGLFYTGIDIAKERSDKEKLQHFIDKEVSRKVEREKLSSAASTAAKHGLFDLAIELADMAAKFDEAAEFALLKGDMETAKRYFARVIEEGKKYAEEDPKLHYPINTKLVIKFARLNRPEFNDLAKEAISILYPRVRRIRDYETAAELAESIGDLPAALENYAKKKDWGNATIIAHRAKDKRGKIFYKNFLDEIKKRETEHTKEMRKYKTQLKRDYEWTFQTDVLKVAAAIGDKKRADYAYDVMIRTWERELAFDPAIESATHMNDVEMTKVYKKLKELLPRKSELGSWGMALVQQLNW